MADIYENTEYKKLEQQLEIYIKQQQDIHNKIQIIIDQMQKLVNDNEIKNPELVNSQTRVAPGVTIEQVDNDEVNKENVKTDDIDNTVKPESNEKPKRRRIIRKKVQRKIKETDEKL